MMKTLELYFPIKVQKKKRRRRRRRTRSVSMYVYKSLIISQQLLLCVGPLFPAVLIFCGGKCNEIRPVDHAGVRQIFS